MDFFTVSTLVDAFSYAIMLEDKQKGKTCFATKPTGRTSEKKSPANSNKSRQPSQSTVPNPNHGKKHPQKDKRERSKQPLIGKWCDYQNSPWHDTFECKARKKFLEKLSTSNLSDKP